MGKYRGDVTTQHDQVSAELDDALVDVALQQIDREAEVTGVPLQRGAHASGDVVPVA